MSSTQHVHLRRLVVRIVMPCSLFLLRLRQSGYESGLVRGRGQGMVDGFATGFSQGAQVAQEVHTHHTHVIGFYDDISLLHRSVSISVLLSTRWTCSMLVPLQWNVVILSQPLSLQVTLTTPKQRSKSKFERRKIPCVCTCMCMCESHNYCVVGVVASSGTCTSQSL